MAISTNSFFISILARKGAILNKHYAKLRTISDIPKFYTIRTAFFCVILSFFSTLALCILCVVMDAADFFVTEGIGGGQADIVSVMVGVA